MQVGIYFKLLFNTSVNARIISMSLSAFALVYCEHTFELRITAVIYVIRAAARGKYVFMYDL